jgi:hypothetical protein
VLQNQLQLAQAEQRRTEELAQRFKKAENESERMAAVRAAGYDQVGLMHMTMILTGCLVSFAHAHKLPMPSFPDLAQRHSVA